MHFHYITSVISTAAEVNECQCRQLKVQIKYHLLLCHVFAADAAL